MTWRRLEQIHDGELDPTGPGAFGPPNESNSFEIEPVMAKPPTIEKQ